MQKNRSAATCRRYTSRGRFCIKLKSLEGYLDTDECYTSDISYISSFSNNNNNIPKCKSVQDTSYNMHNRKFQSLARPHSEIAALQDLFEFADVTPETAGANIRNTFYLDRFGYANDCGDDIAEINVYIYNSGRNPCCTNTDESDQCKNLSIGLECHEYISRFLASNGGMIKQLNIYSPMGNEYWSRNGASILAKGNNTSYLLTNQTIRKKPSRPKVTDTMTNKSNHSRPIINNVKDTAS